MSRQPAATRRPGRGGRSWQRSDRRGSRPGPGTRPQQSVGQSGHANSSAGLLGPPPGSYQGPYEPGPCYHGSGPGQYGSGPGQYGSGPGQYGYGPEGQYGSGQYGYGPEGQYGSGAGQYGPGPGPGQYGSEEGQYRSRPGQYGSGQWQYGSGPGQYGSGQWQYGSGSGQYGSGPGQYGPGHNGAYFEPGHSQVNNGPGSNNNDGGRGGRDRRHNRNDRIKEFGSQSSLVSEGGNFNRGRGGRRREKDRTGGFGSQSSLSSNERGKFERGRGGRRGRREHDNSDDRMSEFGSQSSLASEGGHPHREGGRHGYSHNEYSGSQLSLESEDGSSNRGRGRRGEESAKQSRGRGRGQWERRGRGNSRRGRGQVHDSSRGESNNPTEIKSLLESIGLSDLGMRGRGRGRSSSNSRGGRSGRYRGRVGRRGVGSRGGSRNHASREQQSVGSNSSVVLEDLEEQIFISDEVGKFDEDRSVKTEDSYDRERNNREKQKQKQKSAWIEKEETGSESDMLDEDESLMSRKSLKPKVLPRKKHVVVGKGLSKVGRGKMAGRSKKKTEQTISSIVGRMSGNETSHENGIGDLLKELEKVSSKYVEEEADLGELFGVEEAGTVPEDEAAGAPPAAAQTRRVSSHEEKPADPADAHPGTPQEEGNVQKAFKTLLTEFGGRATMFELLKQETSFPPSFFNTQWLKKHRSKFRIFEKNGLIECISVNHPKAKLCVYFNEPNGCKNEECGYFHVCKGFVSETCKPHIQKCPRTHNFKEGQNDHLIKQFGFEELKNKEISRIIRRSVPEICKAYNQGVTHEEDSCPDLHLCERVMSCKRSSCQLEHRCQSTDHNRWVLVCFRLSKVNSRFLMNLILGQKKDSPSAKTNCPRHASDLEESSSSLRGESSLIDLATVDPAMVADCKITGRVNISNSQNPVGIPHKLQTEKLAAYKTQERYGSGPGQYGSDEAQYGSDDWNYGSDERPYGSDDGSYGSDERPYGYYADNFGSEIRKVCPNKISDGQLSYKFGKVVSTDTNETYKARLGNFGETDDSARAVVVMETNRNLLKGPTYTSHFVAEQPMDTSGTTQGLFEDLYMTSSPYSVKLALPRNTPSRETLREQPSESSQFSTVNSDKPPVRPRRTPTVKSIAAGQFLCEKHIWGTCTETAPCPQYHGLQYKLPYHWQLETQQGNWQDLHDTANQQLESSFCELKSSAEVLITVGVNITVNLDKMKATMQGCRINVRRLSTKSYSQGSGSLLHLTFWCWYFKDINHRWAPYEPDKAQYILEKKFLHGQANYLFARDKFHYKLSFTDMEQENLETGKIRAVLRRPMYVSAEDVSQSIILTHPCWLQQAPERNNELPDHWAPLDILQPFELVSLDPSASSYREVSSQFYKTLSRSHFSISSLYQVQNSSMWIKHCSQRRSMEEQANREGRQEKVKDAMLFHGTDSEEVVRGICVNGFDHRKCGKNGTVYGKGAYFALESKYSNNYTGSKKKKYMFLAKVLVGKYVKGKSEFARPPERIGHVLYDSCVNDMANPTIFVLFDQNQAYPEYLIEYDDLRPASPPSGYPGTYGAQSLSTSAASSGSTGRPSAASSASYRRPQNVSTPQFSSTPSPVVTGPSSQGRGQTVTPPAPAQPSTRPQASKESKCVVM